MSSQSPPISSGSMLKPSSIGHHLAMNLPLHYLNKVSNHVEVDPLSRTKALDLD